MVCSVSLLVHLVKQWFSTITLTLVFLTTWRLHKKRFIVSCVGKLLKEAFQQGLPDLVSSIGVTTYNRTGSGLLSINVCIRSHHNSDERWAASLVAWTVRFSMAVSKIRDFTPPSILPGCIMHSLSLSNLIRLDLEKRVLTGAGRKSIGSYSVRFLEKTDPKAKFFYWAGRPMWYVHTCVTVQTVRKNRGTVHKISWTSHRMAD